MTYKIITLGCNVANKLGQGQQWMKTFSASVQILVCEKGDRKKEWA